MTIYINRTISRNGFERRKRKLRFLRMTGPHYVVGRRSRRMTAVWRLRPRRLAQEARP